MALPHYPAAFWVCAVAAVMLIGITKAGFGGGVGVLATPLMALTIPVADAAALVLPLLMVSDIFALSHYRAAFDRRSVKLMLPGAVMGVAVGGFFFGYFSHNERALQIGIGALSLLFVAFQALREVILGALGRRHPHAAEGVAMGAVTGFTSTLAHAGGAPAVMYLLPLRLPRDVFVGTTVVFFAAVNVVKLVPYGMLGLLRMGNLLTTLVLAPLSYFGVRLGIYLNGRISEVWFSRVVYSVLFLTGLQLLIGRDLLSLL